MHKEWTMLLGRYQVPKPHEGHCELVRALLNEGKNVCIALREADGSDKNPYGFEKRRSGFYSVFSKEIDEGRVKIIEIPDIVEVAYGRTPGWHIKEIKLPENLTKISATEIRKQNEQ